MKSNHRFGFFQRGTAKAAPRGSFAVAAVLALGIGVTGLLGAACSPTGSTGVDAAVEPDAASDQCPQTPCPEGNWCYNGRCMPCDTDTHCGLKCSDCTQGRHPVCVNGQCWCTENEQCGQGFWCDEGECKECADDDPEHCGETCAVCSGLAPVCVDGQCGCDGDGDCADGFWCNADNLCEECNTSAHCGMECNACPTETPICHEGGCVACIEAGDCESGHWCTPGGLCEPCADDDPDHCGSQCAVCSGQTPLCFEGACTCDATSCGDYYRCDTNGSCVLCNTVEYCGAGCDPCVDPTPFCRADGQNCAECLADPDCTEPDTHCENDVCVPDCLAQGCVTDNNPDGEDCAHAKIVGRLDAINLVTYSGDTTGDGDDDDLSTNDSDCWDAKYDNFFRIYLIAGDQLDADLYGLEWEFDAMMKLYSGTDCADNGENDLISCTNDGGDGNDESLTYVAPADGWYTLVVDGRSAFSNEEDYGYYDLDIVLTCVDTNCCCP